MEKSNYYDFNLPEDTDNADQNQYNENFETLDATLYNMQSQINGKQDAIKVINKRVTLADLTWTASAQGMYYSSYFAIDGISNIFAITLGAFQAWRATDIFIPRISTDGTQMQILSNVNSFANLAYAEYRVIGV